MHNARMIREDLYYVGASDRRLNLFENVYPIPMGVSYNSYLLLDGKTALLDTCDRSVESVFMENVAHVLKGRPLDYLVVDHMEPDHGATVLRVMEKYPQAQVICTAGAAKMIGQFFDGVPMGRIRMVKEGEKLCLGKHTLAFYTAPMVHWPEVMVTYDETDGTLFSADAFGTFGALGGDLYADEDKPDLGEMRRYYANIVGKYGVQVQNLMKKAANLDIRMICPLHGPIWRQDLDRLIEKYGLWSCWEGEEGLVIFCASIYGGTMNAMERLASMLSERGVKGVKLYDISTQDKSFLVAEAYRCRVAVLASASYNAGVFVKMEDFLHDLKAHDFKNHRVAYVENGSWAPSAAKTMKAILEGQALETLGETVTLRSAAHEKDAAALEALADALCAAMKE